MYQLFYNT